MRLDIFLLEKTPENCVFSGKIESTLLEISPMKSGSIGGNKVCLVY